MNVSENYSPLTSETLCRRLGDLDPLKQNVGPDPSGWKVKEVGDGNLNLVFIVEGSAGAVVVKQALPYARLVGEGWPLPLYRAFFEYNALTRQALRDPGSVPEIYYFDDAQAMIVMEYLSPHTILRGKLIKGESVDDLASVLGRFCARTAFRGSDLSMDTADRKADAALFLGNVKITEITENLVFCDPYFAAEMNHHTAGLDPIVDRLRADVELKAAVQQLFARFSANAETMLHGDLHTGSIMCTDSETRIIDPEFGIYGPMGFDLGMLVANFLMAYFSQPAHRADGDLDSYQAWILGTIEGVFDNFDQEFRRLWNTERTGILYPRSLFEDAGQSSEIAVTNYLKSFMRDAVGFCGIEMHRRVLSLAHNADFEEIEDPTVRARLEARNLMFGRDLILNAERFGTPASITDAARAYNSENIL